MMLRKSRNDQQVHEREQSVRNCTEIHERCPRFDREIAIKVEPRIFAYASTWKATIIRFVFLPTLLSCSSRFLRDLQQNRAQVSPLVKHHTYRFYQNMGK